MAPHPTPRPRWRPVPALIVLLFATAVAVQRAEANPIESGGIDSAAGCTTEGCIGTQTFELGTLPFAPVFGTVEVDPIGLTLSLDLSVVGVSLDTISGNEDNGVAEVEFTDVEYLATDLTVTEGTPGSFTIDFGQDASIDGDETQWNDVSVAVNGTPAPFSDSDVSVTGNCFFITPGNASCSFTFGTLGFEMMVGDPTPAPRHFEHTMSLVLVPEPSRWLLLASGVAGLLVIGRVRYQNSV